MRKQRTAKPAADLTRDGLYNARGDGHNPLTQAQAYDLRRNMHGAWADAGHNPESCADLLLLLYALAHEEDGGLRWRIYDDAREIFAVAAAPRACPASCVHGVTSRS